MANATEQMQFLFGLILIEIRTCIFNTRKTVKVYDCPTAKYYLNIKSHILKQTVLTSEVK